MPRTSAIQACSVHFSPDEWLSSALQRACFRLSPVRGAIPPAVAADMVRLAAGSRAFFYAKVPTSDIATCQALGRAGFTVVDTAITLSLEATGRCAPSHVSVGIARPEHHGPVARIAAGCFRWSRFHLDPLIDGATADELKRRWTENALRGGRGDGVYVADVKGRVSGFLAVATSSAAGVRSAAIDLIGVSAEDQGAGIGTALINAYSADWRGRVDRLIVGTQAANVRSLRFYESNGFRVSATQYVLHAHIDAGEAT
jgi:GNAT superfamily N-acetyltransferase